MEDPTGKMLAKKQSEFATENGCVLERIFFSKAFHVSIKLLENEILEGVLVRERGARKIARPFHGLYIQTGSKVKLSFITEWWDDEAASNALTAVNGTICNCGDPSEYLILRWFEIRERTDQLAPFDETGTEILFSYSHQDYFENKK